jgi:plasmid maintenance system antidote protein VapI
MNYRRPNSHALDVYETYYLQRLTVERTAEFFDISPNEANRLITKGRLIYNRLAVQDKHARGLSAEN